MAQAILIAGAEGQVGRELAIAQNAQRVIALSHRQLDITKADEVKSAFTRHQPDIVINAAAYTQVDRAEEETSRAFSINRDGVAELALACDNAQIPLLHISTDFVFDGEKIGAYTEADSVAPLNVYGKSKAAGEVALQTCLAQHIILRTSWVFSDSGQNFVKTMLQLAQTRDELNILDDRRGCPTSARTIAMVLLQIADRYLRGEDVPWGTYHYSNQPATTWYGFAREIFKQARGYDKLRLNPIDSRELPAPAERPRNSVLDCSKIARTFGLEPINWRDELGMII